jgi:hypothetical protein
MSDFGRVYRILVHKAPEPVDINTKELNARWFDEFEQVLEITNIGRDHYHRIEFEIDKDLKGTPNQCKLKIYNLSVASRDLFKGSPVKVRLEAGYDNAPRLLFLGDMRFADSDLKGLDWVTTLQLADGGRAYANARVNKSFAKGTPLRTILDSLAKAFGVPLELQSRSSSDLDQRIAAGEVITGWAADELERLLLPYGFGFSFQNQRLQLLRVDKILPGEIRVIREDTGDGGGMLGTPEIDPPKIRAPPKVGHRGRSTARAKVPKLKVKHTLYPELIPGERIEMQTRSVKGTFKIDSLKHKGDTHGNDWVTEIQAVDVPDVVTA